MDHTDTELGTNPQKVNSNTEAEAVFAIELSRAPPSHVSTGSVDGSRRAWVQVLGCFVMFFNIWGYPSVWGSFQEYYSSQLLSHYSSASIAWIGSTQSTLLIVVGILSGPIFDLGYYRALIFSGAIICVIGAILVSFATKYWHVFLCQGLCVGFGCGLLFIPTLALVTRSFKRAREFAVAIVFCGTPIGAISYGLVFSRLIDHLGFPSTARVMAYIMMGTFATALPLVLWGASNIGQIVDGRKRKMLDKVAMTDVAFWAFTAALSTSGFAYWIPYDYIPTFSRKALGTSSAWGSYMLMISQAASVFGRFTAAFSARHFGIMVSWTVATLVSGAVCLFWISVDNFDTYIGFCILWGFCSGPLVPLPASIFPTVCPDPKVLGARLGMAEAIASLFNLLGPPIAGALIRKSKDKQREYLGLQIFAGLVFMVGGAELIYLWWYLVKKRRTVLFI